MQQLKELKGKELVPGLFARFVHGKSMTLSFVEIRPDVTMSIHSHPHEQITHILEGELEMTIDGEKILLTAGMVHLIPGNTPHGAYSRTAVKLIDAFSPVREDYIIQ